jgi:ribosome-binding protein aMBF1 (putative translation factor)
LAKELRVNKNTLYEWENEGQGPSRKGTEKLERFFNVSTKILEDFERRQRKKASEGG